MKRVRSGLEQDGPIAKKDTAAEEATVRLDVIEKGMAMDHAGITGWGRNDVGGGFKALESCKCREE